MGVNKQSNNKNGGGVCNEGQRNPTSRDRQVRLSRWTGSQAHEAPLVVMLGWASSQGVRVVWCASHSTGWCDWIPDINDFREEWVVWIMVQGPLSSVTWRANARSFFGTLFKSESKNWEHRFLIFIQSRTPFHGMTQRPTLGLGLYPTANPSGNALRDAPKSVPCSCPSWPWRQPSYLVT